MYLCDNLLKCQPVIDMGQLCDMAHLL